MKRLRLSRYAKTRLKLAGILLGGALALHSCGDTEPVPTADPAEVERFLATMEASQPAFAAGDQDERDGDGKQLRNFVEGAAVRAPSVATVDRIETVVARRLS